MTQESTGEKVTCPVCNAQCEALVQYCEQCGWHFELFLSQPDQQQQYAYQQRLERHRTLWERSNNEPKKTVRDVPNPLTPEQLTKVSDFDEQTTDDAEIEDIQSTESLTASNAAQLASIADEKANNSLSTRSKVIMVVCILWIFGGLCSLLISSNNRNVKTIESKKNASKLTFRTNANIKNDPPKDRDRDRDRDGIYDKNDQCPNKAEDFDGFKDSDGCPDLDNDSDGIVDRNDQCPDIVGTHENQGCPIKDDDKDGIPNHKDKCPNKPETYNGIVDHDGCPDGKVTVKVSDNEVKIFQKVFFDTGKSTIKKKSFRLLNTVAYVLSKYPEITLVSVDGHTDDIGDYKENLKLSKARAKSVRQYLINKGIKQSRLSYEGFGESKPLCKDFNSPSSRHNDACRSDNRRVAFTVITLNNKFNIPKHLRLKYPDLIKMILATESMNNNERYYWLNLLPKMTKEQIKNLFDILDNERKKLKEIDLFYSRKIK